MTGSSSPKGSPAHWLSDKALRGLIGTVLRLPYERRVRFMGAVMRRAVGPLAGYKQRALDNLALIYPEIAEDRRHEIAEAACDNFGRTLIENYSWQDLGARLDGIKIEGEGLPALEQAKAEGRPVIFVTGHYANHEVPRHLLTQAGHTIGGIYRPMSNPYFNAHYAKTMTSWGGAVFEQGRRGTAGFVKHLRAGGMATLLFDVAASQGEPIPFLGRAANTSLSAAEIAQRTGALVLPYFAERLADGLNFSARLEAPIPDGDPIQMMQAMTARLEAQITKQPEQWFWVHRRWKHAGELA